jgi:hypothetical protein
MLEVEKPVPMFELGGHDKAPVLSDVFRGKPDDAKIAMKFWTGVHPIDPSKYTIDCGGKIPSVEDLRDKITEIYNREGLVYITNTGLTELPDMRPYLDVALKDSMVYEGGANSRGSLDPFFYEVGAPLCAQLPYHHEMTYVAKSTNQLGFCCKNAPKKGGATFFSESFLGTDELMATPLGQKMKQLGVTYCRNLTDADAYADKDQSMIYNHWQTSFGVKTIEEAVEKAKKVGLDSEVSVDCLGNPNFLKTKYTTDVFEWAPNWERNVLYSSIADHEAWFDYWPGVMEMAPEHRWIKMTWGDGSEISMEEWKQWCAIYDKYGFPIEWKVGDIACVCNYRFAHGRPGIHMEPDDKRELGVVLGPTFDRVGSKPDAW